MLPLLPLYSPQYWQYRHAGKASKGGGGLLKLIPACWMDGCLLAAFNRPPQPSFTFLRRTGEIIPGWRMRCWFWLIRGLFNSEASISLFLPLEANPGWRQETLSSRAWSLQLHTAHNEHYTLHTVHCTLHTAHCTLHTAHSTLHTAYYTILKTQYVLNTTLHTYHYTLVWAQGADKDRL